MSSHFERMEKLKEELPDEYIDTFETLTGQGASPSGVAAAIEWVDTNKTQDQLADEYGVSTVTIRSNANEVSALMSDALICEDCTEPIKTYRKDNRTLEIGCNCKSRSIKTSNAFPPIWS